MDFINLRANNLVWRKFQPFYLKAKNIILTAAEKTKKTFNLLRE